MLEYFSASSFPAEAEGFESAYYLVNAAHLRVYNNRTPHSSEFEVFIVNGTAEDSFSVLHVCM